MAEKVEFIESYIKGVNGSADYQWNDNHGELVRCKNCKHWVKNPESKYGECIIRQTMSSGFCTIGDWFCADGEKKNG